MDKVFFEMHKVNIKENGIMEKWMDLVVIIGMMVEYIKVIILMIKNKDLVCLNGQIKQFIKVIGRMDYSKVKEKLFWKTEFLKQEYGMKESLKN